MEFDFIENFRKKNRNIKLYENPSSGRQVFPCAQTDGRTDMTMLIVVFLNFANAPKNSNHPNLNPLAGITNINTGFGKEKRRQFD